jgi:tight adherence protein C
MTDTLALRIAAVAALLVAVVLGCFLALVAERQQKVETRVRFALGEKRTLAPVAAKKVQLENVLVGIRKLGLMIIDSGILSRKVIADLEQTLAASGYRPGSAVSVVVGAKVVLMIVLPMLGYFGANAIGHGSSAMMVAAGCAAVGMMAPDSIIGRMRKKYLAAVERGLPDALDLMVICADAGLPLETAMERVALEFRETDPATANELALTAGEMKMRPDRRGALMNLGKRTGLDSLQALGATLAQTLQYGTPLAQALRTLSAEMRHTMLTRFEEKAARLPVLLTLPMIMFFLPCVLLVAGGPAAVQVFHMLHG